MKSIYKIIAVVLMIAVIIPCSSTAFAVSLYVDGDYTYADIDSYSVALYAYSGEDPVLTVPEVFAGRYVSEIYEYAFEENTAITGIDFTQNGNRMRIINTKAFNECTSLSGALSLPSSVRTLGFAAFQGCVSLNSLTVNYGLSEIPAQCFNRCAGLKEVTLSPSVESIGNLAFAKCSSLESVYLPSSVTYISTSAFNDSAPTLYVYYDSYSHHFAEEKGFRYVVLNPPVDPTEPPTEAPIDDPTEPVTEPVTEAPKEAVTPTDAPAPTVEPTELPTESVTEAPTQQPTELPTEISGYYLGDVNGDGVVDVIDVSLIQRHLALLPIDGEFAAMRGDVNGDGYLTILDATFIQRYISKLDVDLPIGEFVAG